MKKLICITLFGVLFFTACASKSKEIPKKSPCACNYDIVKVS
ncbi:hypothetical protein [Campylobacter cuniculorum]|nr:hypothetical protein [Campylobacter cuniculorum]